MSRTSHAQMWGGANRNRSVIGYHEDDELGNLLQAFDEKMARSTYKAIEARQAIS